MTDTQHENTPARAGQVRRRVLALAGVTAAAGTIMVLSSLGSGASAAPAAAAPAAKYFVCKYVGKPGVDERLQTGQNPISVNGNAIPENPVVVGSFFADAQGRSYVLVEDTGQPKPPVSQCPQPQGPPSSTPATTPVTTPITTSVSTPVTTPATTPVTTPVSTPVTTPTTETVSPTSSHVVVPPTSVGPIPGGVSAGLHSPVRYAGVKAWGTILMLLGGAVGLAAGVWPTRRRAH